MESSKQNITGLKRVAERQTWYLDLSGLLFKERPESVDPREFANARKSLRDSMVALYSSLLEYQMKSVYAYYKWHRLVTFAGDQLNLNDWKGDSDDIKAKENQFLKDVKHFDLQLKLELESRLLETTQAMFDDATRSKINALISTFSVSGLNYEEFRQFSGKPADGTCEWFRQHKVYEEWKSFSRGILVISAYPGVGKSVLCSSLVDEMKGSATGDDVVLHFFFRDKYLQNQARFALCSILHQFFTKRPDLVLYHRDKIERVSAETLQRDLRQLWSIFTESIGGVKVVCVFDGLDECQETSLKLLMELMKSFLETTSQDVRFITSCRPYRNIVRPLGSIHVNCVVLDTSDEEVAQISTEIDSVIDEKLQDMCQRQVDPLNPDFVDDIKESLKTNSNRTYLWVRLIFDVLEESLLTTKDALLKSIQELPQNVEEAYDLLLKRVPANSRESIHGILAMLVTSVRPLTDVELFIAHNAYIDVNKNRNAPTKAQPTEAEVEEFRVWLQNSCGFCVQVFEGKVSFVHQTVKEYLVSDDDSEGGEDMRLGKGCISFRSSHCILAETCILYLCKKEFFGSEVIARLEQMSEVGEYALSTHFPKTTDSQDLFPDLEFLSYAAKNWRRHFRFCQRLDVSPGSYTIRDVRPKMRTKYYWLIERSNVWLIRAPYWHIRNWWPPKGFKFRSRSPLMERSNLEIGLIWGHLLPMDRGISKGQLETVDGSFRAAAEAVQEACKADDLDILTLLFLNGTPYESPGYISPLFHCQSPEAVRILVNAGADVNWHASDGTTPLLNAIKHYKVAVAEELLDKGADPGATVIEKIDEKNNDRAYYSDTSSENSMDDATDVEGLEDNSTSDKITGHDSTGVGGSTALHFLRKRYDFRYTIEHDEWLEWMELLTRNLDINSLDGQGRSLLHLLASMPSDHVAIGIQALVDENADVDLPIRGQESRTALHICQTSQAAECLLERGAGTDFLDPDGKTALQAAWDEDRREVYGVLLVHQTRDGPNLIDEDGWRPLYRACYGGTAETVLALLERGAHPNLKGPSERSALLMYLQRNEYISKYVVDELFAKMRSNDGTLVLGESTISQEHQENFQTLVSFGNSTRDICLLIVRSWEVADNVKNALGHTATFLFAQAATVTQFEEAGKICRMLCEAPFHTTNEARSQGTAALYAILGDWERLMRWPEAILECCEIFLLHGADPNMEDIYGQTPFLLLVTNLTTIRGEWLDDYRTKFMELFVSHGAKKFAGDKLAGDSPITVICHGSTGHSSARDTSGAQGRLIALAGRGRRDDGPRHDESHVKMLEILLREGRDLTDGSGGEEDDISKYTEPLCHLCEFKAKTVHTATMVNLLLEAGADPKKVEWYQHTPLNCILRGLDRWLWRQDEVQEEDKYQVGTYEINKEIIQDLVAHGASLSQVNQGDSANDLVKRLMSAAPDAGLTVSPDVWPVRRADFGSFWQDMHDLERSTAGAPFEEVDGQDSVNEHGGSS